jgi:hypothetical protein
MLSSEPGDIVRSVRYAAPAAIAAHHLPLFQETPMIRNSISVSVASLFVGAASGSMTLPGDFESQPALLRPAFSYFDGVVSYGTELSDKLVHSGKSMAVIIKFQHDPVFKVAGAGFSSELMAPGTGTSAGTRADVVTFSVLSPVSGSISVMVRLDEDDHKDGVIDVEEDDRWESKPIMLSAGVQTITIPIERLTDTNPGFGNDSRQFSTAAVRYTLVFETRTTYPGGMLDEPVTLWVDHLALAPADGQPPNNCKADFNGDGFRDPDDLADFINCFFMEVQFPGACKKADVDSDGRTQPDDLADFITSFFQGC